jgi:hypothetical protein
LRRIIVGMVPPSSVPNLDSEGAALPRQTPFPR